MGVVAHPQGPLAHGPLLPVGFQSVLAIGLGGEGVQVGAHLWMGHSEWVGTGAPGPCTLGSPPLLLPACRPSLLLAAMMRAGRGGGVGRGDW